MDLIHLFYKHAGKQREILLVSFGDTCGDKWIGLESSRLLDLDVKKLRGNTKLLNSLPESDRINWCKHNLPSYRRAYREIYKSRAKEQTRYEMRASHG